MNEVKELSAAAETQSPPAPTSNQREAAVLHDLVIPAQACPTCNAPRTQAQMTPNSWVYVIGDVDARFPSLAVEKEVIGAMAQADTAGLSNEAALQRVLDISSNAYLVREMCWVLLVQGVETYVLVPHYSQDYPMLVEAARLELSAVIGTLGPIANPDVCNGLTLPFLIFDVIYSFDRPRFVAEMPVPEGADAERFRATATDIFDQIVQLITSGTGMERALAYLLMKDPRLYYLIADAYNRNAQLSAVELKPAPVMSTHNLVDVIVRTQDRGIGVQSSIYARVALAAKLPYVITYWQPYLGQ
ncbi:MAG: hypothetical protein JO182_30585 [Acidobacteriaceae bacterium]|nr:hypothetical protein [Acidobacteriaceae bacterium]